MNLPQSVESAKAIEELIEHLTFLDRKAGWKIERTENDFGVTIQATRYGCNTLYSAVKLASTVIEARDRGAACGSSAAIKEAMDKLWGRAIAGESGASTPATQAV